jgi:hypothetical protein
MSFSFIFLFFLFSFSFYFFLFSPFYFPLCLSPPYPSLIHSHVDVAVSRLHRMPRLPAGAGRQGSTSLRGRGACECLQPPAATSPTGTFPHQRPHPSALSPGVLSLSVLFPARPPQAHPPSCAGRGSPPSEHLWKPAQENTVLSPKPIHFGH